LLDSLLQEILGITMWRGLLCHLLASLIGVALAQEADDPLEALRTNIPGEPGLDYPIHNIVQETSFTCDGKEFGGYYADPEMDCQAYHICLMEPENNEALYPISFLCPNGTIFNQEVFVCEWWFNVDCSLAESHYAKNEGLFAGGSGGGHPIGGEECPALDQLDQKDCQGAVSTCWSPGQPDGDCPNFGLCCFDGCANTCGEEYTAQKPQPRTTTAGYSYDEPKVTLPVRPQTTPRRTTTRRTTTPLPSLYEGPPRSGRRLSNRNRNDDTILLV